METERERQEGGIKAKEVKETKGLRIKEKSQKERRKEKSNQ